MSTFHAFVTIAALSVKAPAVPVKNIPTAAPSAATAAYWCRVGERTHLRWSRSDDEDAATAALARLHARGELAGESGLGPGTRFLGAFRAGGLLAPVWDLDPALEAADYEDALASLAPR